MQYLDLVIPDRAIMDKMLDEWLGRVKGSTDDDFSSLASMEIVRATPSSTKPTASAAASATRDSANNEVLSIRHQVDELLTDIDESFSESASPMSSAQSTPRGYTDFPDQQSLLMRALLSSVEELNTAALQYGALFKSMQKEAIPLLNAEMDARLARASQVEQRLTQENSRVRGECERLKQELALAFEQASANLQNAALLEASQVSAAREDVLVRNIFEVFLFFYPCIHLFFIPSPVCSSSNLG
jgi:hypothetical protein